MTSNATREAERDRIRRLSQFNEHVQQQASRAGDRRLADEMQEKRSETARALESRESMLESNLPDGQRVESDFALETIVLRTGRPVLEVAENQPKLEFREESESKVWKERLVAANSLLVPAIRAVGRIDLVNNPRFTWVGTGWLVAPTVIVTNRHVAGEFATGHNGKFVFRAGLGGAMGASVDFLEEFGRPETLLFRVKRVLHIEPEGGPDMAFLEVDPASNSAALASPIRLGNPAAGKDNFVAAIGYPARDSRIPDLDLMENIFGDVFDKKRLAPGQLTAATADQVKHDCSTLGGNSGSVVLDLASGEAVALHFAGRFLEANFAVPAPLVRDRLARLNSGGVSVSVHDSKPSTPQSPPLRVREQTDAQASSFTFNIPLTISVQLGRPAQAVAAAAAAAVSQAAAAAEEVFAEEAPPESYANREGFLSDFLGRGHTVKMPEIRRDAGQILKFDLDGKSSSELKYEHFTVVMNARRRMCFFSACNIDGKQSKRSIRAGWKFDSRIPQKFQIMKECYGNAPKFSRGHMTRREDPAWGDRSTANLGNEDSMHVTNTVPQMQSFNAGIWLSLEDFALQNAREDDMRLSVITGPFLHNNDPVRFDVKIPREFWKVIAFIHDQTGELTATGYSISQDDFLREEEFVFGEFQTFQRSLSWIENKAGISFGALSGHDPLADAEEAMEAPLTGLDQIRFTR